MKLKLISVTPRPATTVDIANSDRSVISSTYGRVDVYNDALGASQVVSIILALAHDVVAVI